MFEKLTKMRDLVKEEMKHIPRGDQYQNYLRMYYWPLRLTSLKGGIESKTKEEVLKDCINKIKEEKPDFKAQYKDEYFKM